MSEIAIFQKLTELVRHAHRSRNGTSGQITDGAVLRAGSELPFCELIFRVEKSVEVRPEECCPVRAGCV